MDTSAAATLRPAHRTKIVGGAVAAIAIVALGFAAGFGLLSPSGALSPVVAVAGNTADQPDASILDLSALSRTSDRVRVSGKLSRGSTLQQALISAGADRSDAHRAMQAIYTADLLDPRRLQIGLEVDALLSKQMDSGRWIDALSLSPAPGKHIMVKRHRDEFFAFELNANLTPAPRRIVAPIQTSLYETALNLGAQDEQIAGFASAFAYDVDFQREIHPGDEFEMVFQTWQDERGQTIKTGEVIYAELNGKQTSKAYYRHTPSDDGISAWFDAAGESATRFLMKTPINGARLSSNFGRRRHPISGYSRLHKGTDFAASTGTPVYAAGNGIVERASRYGGYGKYVRIRHANGYKTAYAHLSRYGSAAKTGRSVRQGDVIGYVGSTGASTGPHLHYEVIVSGRHVNAMSLDLPTGRKLAEADGMLAEFALKRSAIDQIRRRLGAEIEVIATGTGLRAK